MMRFASLGSGSEGNCLLVEAGTTRLMVDCGFPLRETLARLARLDVVPESISAVLVTHEHDDHVRGASRFAKNFGVPLVLTYGTLQAAFRRVTKGVQTQVFDCHQRFALDDIEIEPYTVPHDAREPSQFVFGDGALRVGLLTDAGSLTPHMLGVLNRLDALILECNHDLDMLWNGAYPRMLKERIGGNFGHLDNDTAARLLERVDCSRLQHVVAAHLSKQNNKPELACASLSHALGCQPSWIGVASQDEGFGWRQVN